MKILTVGELITHLSRFPKDTRVVTIGWFGEPYDLTIHNFSKQALVFGKKEPIVVNVTVPDIGPEPD